MQDLQQNNSGYARPQAYILCGGQSNRFGSDKSRHIIDGVPMISLIADALSNWSKSVIAIADKKDKYQDLELKTIADLQPGLGPLGGLQTALTHARQHSKNDWIVLTSCDMTKLTENWLNQLWLQTQSSPPAKAILFSETTQSRLHPFPGFYHVDLLPHIEKQIQSKKLSFHRLIQNPETDAKILPIPQDWPSIPQINTIQDAENWKNSTQ